MIGGVTILSEIIWMGGLPHLSGLPHLHSVPHKYLKLQSNHIKEYKQEKDKKTVRGSGGMGNFVCKKICIIYVIIQVVHGNCTITPQQFRSPQNGRNILEITNVT